MSDESQIENTISASAHKETRHEAHRHARPRVLWGVAAVALIGAGLLVWSRWGDSIKEACFGKDGACPVELGEVPEGGVTFETPTGY